MNKFHVGDKVRISTKSQTTLQHNLIGVVVEHDNTPHFRDYLTVELQPNDECLYGGKYWFAPDELEPIEIGGQ